MIQDPSVMHFVRNDTAQAICLWVYAVSTGASLVYALFNLRKLTGIITEKRLKTRSSNGSDMTSFSRVTGLVGIVYLTAFMWCLGFFVLDSIWSTPDQVAKVIASSGQFVMGGAALFAPYAFNQLSQIFSKSQQLPDSSKAQVPGADAPPSIADVQRLLQPRG